MYVLPALKIGSLKYVFCIYGHLMRLTVNRNYYLNSI
jgi:hypothetical protein